MGNKPSRSRTMTMDADSDGNWRRTYQQRSLHRNIQDRIHLRHYSTNIPIAPCKIWDYAFQEFQRRCQREYSQYRSLILTESNVDVEAEEMLQKHVLTLREGLALTELQKKVHKTIQALMALRSDFQNVGTRLVNTLSRASSDVFTLTQILKTLLITGDVRYTSMSYFQMDLDEIPDELVMDFHILSVAVLEVMYYLISLVQASYGKVSSIMDISTPDLPSQFGVNFAVEFFYSNGRPDGISIMNLYGLDEGESNGGKKHIKKFAPFIPYVYFLRDVIMLFSDVDAALVRADDLEDIREIQNKQNPPESGHDEGMEASAKDNSTENPIITIEKEIFVIVVRLAHMCVLQRNQPDLERCRGPLSSILDRVKLTDVPTEIHGLCCVIEGLFQSEATFTGKTAESQEIFLKALRSHVPLKPEIMPSVFGYRFQQPMVDCTEALKNQIMEELRMKFPAVNKSLLASTIAKSPAFNTLIYYVKHLNETLRLTKVTTGVNSDRVTTQLEQSEQPSRAIASTITLMLNMHISFMKKSVIPFILISLSAIRKFPRLEQQVYLESRSTRVAKLLSSSVCALPLIVLKTCLHLIKYTIGRDELEDVEIRSAIRIIWNALFDAGDMLMEMKTPLLMTGYIQAFQSLTDCEFVHCRPKNAVDLLIRMTRLGYLANRYREVQAECSRTFARIVDLHVMDNELDPKLVTKLIDYGFKPTVYSSQELVRSSWGWAFGEFVRRITMLPNAESILLESQNLEDLLRLVIRICEGEQHQKYNGYRAAGCLFTAFPAGNHEPVIMDLVEKIMKIMLKQMGTTTDYKGRWNAAHSLGCLIGSRNLGPMVECPKKATVAMTLSQWLLCSQNLKEKIQCAYGLSRITSRCWLQTADNYKLCVERLLHTMCNIPLEGAQHREKLKHAAARAILTMFALTDPQDVCRLDDTVEGHAETLKAVFDDDLLQCLHSEDFVLLFAAFDRLRAIQKREPESSTVLTFIEILERIDPYDTIILRDRSQKAWR